MFCSGGFAATGEIRLLGAHIAGQLSLQSATLTNPDGPALNADRLQVDQNMVCSDGFAATGEIRLVGAHIGGQLDFTGATLKSPATALDLEDARVRMLLLRFAAQPVATVDLTLAHFERLGDRTYGATREWAACRLQGCRYDLLAADQEPAVEDRLRWLVSDPDGYAPQPYEQLAESYRRSGNDEAARKVLIAKQKRRRTESLTWPAKGWSWFLGATVGHGYRLHYAGLWLIALAVIGSLLFTHAFDADASHTTAAAPTSGKAAATKPRADLTPAKADPPVFQPVLYTIDVLLPVVSLGQDSAWNAHGAAQWITAAGTLLGWLLTTALVAGLIIRRT